MTKVKNTTLTYEIIFPKIAELESQIESLQQDIKEQESIIELAKEKISDLINESNELNFENERMKKLRNTDGSIDLDDVYENEYFMCRKSNTIFRLAYINRNEHAYRQPYQVMLIPISEIKDDSHVYKISETERGTIHGRTIFFKDSVFAESFWFIPDDIMMEYFMSSPEIMSENYENIKNLMKHMHSIRQNRL